MALTEEGADKFTMLQNMLADRDCWPQAMENYGEK